MTTPLIYYYEKNDTFWLRGSDGQIYELIPEEAEEIPPYSELWVNDKDAKEIWENDSDEIDWIEGPRGGLYYIHHSHMRGYAPVKVYKSTIDARKRRRERAKLEKTE